MSEFHETPITETGAHLWGSYYAPDMQQGIREMVAGVGEYVVFGMPDGEINTEDRKRDDWVVGNMMKLEGVPGFITVKHGEYKDYDDMSVLDIAPEGIDPFDVNLGYYDVLKETAPVVRAELEAAGLGQVPLQLGIPGYRQIPTFAFGTRFGQPKGALSPHYLKWSKQATRDELNRLARDPDLNTRGGMGIQSEHPVETIATVEAYRKYGRVGGRAMANIMGRGIANQALWLPRKYGRAAHFCLGRYVGKPAIEFNPEEPGAFEPIVNVMNEAIDHWPKGHTPPRVFGAPVIPEGHTMVDKKAIKEIAAQLGDLALPEGTIFAPGIITPQVSAEDSARLGDAIQEKLGTPIAASASCGLSSLRPGNKHKYSDNVARDTLNKHARVVELMRG